MRSYAARRRRTTVESTPHAHYHPHVIPPPSPPRYLVPCYTAHRHTVSLRGKRGYAMLQHGPYHYCLTLEYAMRELYGSNSRWYQSAGLYSEPKEVREALLDRDGVEIRIPEFALPVLAQRVRQGG